MDADIVRLATVARKEISRFAQRTDLHSYNSTDLACLCGISSWFITRLGNRFDHDINCAMGFFKDNGHCWNVYGLEIIDITATQFGVKDKVHVTRYDDPRYKRRIWCYTEDAFADWPEEQMPQSFDRELQKHLDRATRILAVDPISV